MGWDHDDMNGWGYALMTTSMMVFWAVVILGVIALFRYQGRNQASLERELRPPTPEQLLGERFARGDIDEDELRRRRETLRSMKD